MTSTEVIELGEQFRGAARKIEKAIELMEDQGQHPSVPRIVEQAIRAGEAIQKALDLVVEHGPALSGAGPLFEAEKLVTGLAEIAGEGGSVEVRSGGKIAKIKGRATV